MDDNEDVNDGFIGQRAYHEGVAAHSPRHASLPATRGTRTSRSQVILLAPRLLNSKGDIVAAAPKVFSKFNAGMRAQLLDCSWARLGLERRGLVDPIELCVSEWRRGRITARTLRSMACRSRVAYSPRAAARGRIPPGPLPASTTACRVKRAQQRVFRLLDCSWERGSVQKAWISQALRLNLNLQG